MNTDPSNVRYHYTCVTSCSKQLYKNFMSVSPLVCSSHFSGQYFLECSLKFRDVCRNIHIVRRIKIFVQGHLLKVNVIQAKETTWNGSNLGFPGIKWRTHGINASKSGRLMYHGHLLKLIKFHRLLICFTLVLLWRERNQIWCFRAFSCERMSRMARNLAY